MTAVTLRVCCGDDAAALRRLAERDSADVPAGTLVAAEAGGTLVAAISLESGRVIADPFVPSAHAVELLRRRRLQIRRARGGGPASVPVLGRLLGRPAEPARSA